MENLVKVSSIDKFLQELAQMKADAIEVIESHYPVDSPDEEISRMGKHLLIAAVRERMGAFSSYYQYAIENWRDLGEDTLVEYARLCKLEKSGDSQITMSLVKAVRSLSA